VTFPPGGPTDIIARAVGQKLAEAWGQPVVIDNRAGAGGNIGTDLVAKAPSDGYTLVLSNFGPLIISPFVYSKLPYDPVKDLDAHHACGNQLVLSRRQPVRPREPRSRNSSRLQKQNQGN
jgi:tripartite-type tricarboxylate transporter receptor subunit TctC